MVLPTASPTHLTTHDQAPHRRHYPLLTALETSSVWFALTTRLGDARLTPVYQISLHLSLGRVNISALDVIGDLRARESWMTTR